MGLTDRLAAAQRARSDAPETPQEKSPATASSTAAKPAKKTGTKSSVKKPGKKAEGGDPVEAKPAKKGDKKAKPAADDNDLGIPGASPVGEDDEPAKLPPKVESDAEVPDDEVDI